MTSSHAGVPSVLSLIILHVLRDGRWTAPRLALRTPTHAPRQPGGVSLCLVLTKARTCWRAQRCYWKGVMGCRLRCRWVGCCSLSPSPSRSRRSVLTHRQPVRTVVTSVSTEAICHNSAHALGSFVLKGSMYAVRSAGADDFNDTARSPEHSRLHRWWWWAARVCRMGLSRAFPGRLWHYLQGADLTHVLLARFSLFFCLGPHLWCEQWATRRKSRAASRTRCDFSPLPKSDLLT